MRKSRTIDKRILFHRTVCFQMNVIIQFCCDFLISQLWVWSDCFENFAPCAIIKKLNCCNDRYKCAYNDKCYQRNIPIFAGFIFILTCRHALLNVNNASILIHTCTYWIVISIECKGLITFELLLNFHYYYIVRYVLKY